MNKHLFMHSTEYGRRNLNIAYTQGKLEVGPRARGQLPEVPRPAVTSGLGVRFCNFQLRYLKLKILNNKMGNLSATGVMESIDRPVDTERGQNSVKEKCQRLYDDYNKRVEFLCIPIYTPINKFKDDLNLPTKLSGPQVQKTCSFIESLRDLQNLNNESMDLSEPRVLGAQLEAEGEIKNSKEIVQLWHEMIDQLYVVIEGTWILSGKSKWEFDLLFEEYKELRQKKNSRYRSSPEKLSSKILKVTRGLSNFTKELIPAVNQASVVHKKIHILLFELNGQLLQDIEHRGTLRWIFKQIVGEKWLQKRKNELHLIGKSLNYTQDLTIFLHKMRTTVHLFQESILTLQVVNISFF
ncbi:hypothetical protein BY996DRAFT_6408820 [Phakopsora pachyrhizi]|nr:hypothetical protein BY996DRAFT_6408820 [Phakopsora pachyrhizi]